MDNAVSLYYSLYIVPQLELSLVGIVKALSFTKNNSTFIGYTAGELLRTFFKAEHAFEVISKRDRSE